jgi:hypothetical protein
VKRTFAMLVLVLATGLWAAALDVPLRDGTVIPAASYKITGSYVMLQLPDGRQVAYDVNDVDLEALRAAEAAAAAASAVDGSESDRAVDRRDALSTGRTLKSAHEAEAAEDGSLTISDRDVRHVRGSRVRGEAEEEESGADGEDGVPAGFQQGGRVMLNDLRVSSLGGGRWQVDGEVVNRNPNPVQSVSVRLETLARDDDEPWSGEVPVAALIAPNEKATFSHTFAAEVGEGQAAPNVRASVMWMQEETRRVPDYTKAGGVPHPSNLPLQHGGVSGADVVPTPVQ